MDIILSHKEQEINKLYTDIVIYLQDNTDTGRPQNSVLWSEIAVHQYSTSTNSRMYWERY